MRSELRLLLLLSWLALLPGAATALSVTVAPIAFLGDAAPGVPGGTFATSFGAEVNDAGQVAISGWLAAGGQGNWTWDIAAGGAPTPLLVPGPSPVGPSGSEISIAFAREITSSGVVGWEATLRNGPAGVTSSNDRLLGHYAPPGGHALVAREGDPAPGLPGYTMVLGVNADSLPDWNDAAQMVQAIPAFRPPFDFSGGLYRHEPGSGLSPIYLANDPVPGDPTRYITGGVIQRINEAGELAFAAGTTATPGSGTSDATIFGPDGAGSFFEIARVGAQAPDTPAGTTFRFFPGGGFFALSDVGQVAFAADLEIGPGGVTSADNSGLWTADGPGNIMLRHREGDAIPGLPGLSFAAIAGTPFLNDAGDLAFTTSLALGGSVTTSNNDVLLVSALGGGVTLVAREGDANPILPGELWRGFGVLAWSDDGALLFRALDGSGLTRFYHRAAHGGLSLLTGQGMDVDLGGGDVRTVDLFVDFDASDDGTRLAAATRFTDGSTGLVLFSVPEPDTTLLGALGLAALAARRRLRHALPTASR